MDAAECFGEISFQSDSNACCTDSSESLNDGLTYGASLEELKQRITTALETVMQDMLQRVWQDLDYLREVCRVTELGGIWSLCVGVGGVHHFRKSIKLQHFPHSSTSKHRITRDSSSICST
ncbi:hypothetical protein SRHO_G00029450 [Serrasalmus rhombeus]